ncbi:MAG: sodium-dependent transporter [Rikenellaceae bacterium]
MRKGFSSNFGAIAAAAGSAIGLGNIWRFPYIAGESGGGAFIFVYLLIIAFVGLPMLIAEFSLGRNTQKNAFGVFKQLATNRKWYNVGVLGIVSSFIMLSFYVVIAGWTLAFLINAIKGIYMSMSSAEIQNSFHEFTTSGIAPLPYIALFLISTALIVMSGVDKGIERFNKILMPVLLILLMILCINSFTLDGFKEGIEFIFKPDFSKINADVALNALGQAFFSLSIGMGTMMTYGSYIRTKDNMLFTSSAVAISDVIIALLAGVAIFPAVFTYDIAPSSGPELVFITLPNIFAQMYGGYYLSILFFILLFVAALTSSVSALEVIIACVTEELKWSRKKGVYITTLLLMIMGGVCSLSMAPDSILKIGSKSLFDIFNDGTSIYLMPIGGFFIMIFTGWVLSDKIFKDELSSNGLYKVKYFKLLIFIVKYIAPLAISTIFLSELGFI